MEQSYFLPQTFWPLSFPSAASDTAASPRTVPEISHCSSASVSLFPHSLLALSVPLIWLWERQWDYTGDPW